MKERENREFWPPQMTVLLTMSINRYLYIALYFYCRVSSGLAQPRPERPPREA